MRSKRYVLVLMVVFAPSLAQAGWGSLVREAGELIVKRSTRVAGKAAREGMEAAAKKGASKAARPIVVKAASKLAAHTLTQHGDDVIRIVAREVGDEGTKALAKLSAKGGKQFAEIAGELAHHPSKQAWLALIAEQGDAAAAWLWKRKGSIAVGTAATAVLLQPADFIRASEEMVSTALTTTGEHVVQPLIVESVRHVAGPLAEHTAQAASASFPWTLFWCAALGGAAGYVVHRRRGRKSQR